MKNQNVTTRSRRLRCALALGLATTSGLSAPVQAGDKPPSPKAMKPSWTAKVGPGDAHTTQLAAAGDTIIAAADDGQLTAWDARNGKQRWRHGASTGAAGEVVGLATHGEIVVVAWDKSAQLEALDAQTGKPIWQALLRNMPKNTLICENHRAVVTALVDDGAFAAFAHDPVDGKPLWRTAVGGELVGVGGDHVFIGVRSGVGALDGRIEAVHCATGERTTLPAGGRPFAHFLGAAGGRVALRHFEMGFTNERVCLLDLSGDAEPQCIDPRTGEHKDPITGALVRPDRLLLASRHMYAHNLDPTPDGWLSSQSLPDLSTQWVAGPLRASGSPVWGGGQIVSGFGSTGAADFVHLTDPADGTLIGTLPVAKAPEIIVLANGRGATAIYGGTVVGFDLLRSGPATVDRAAVTPVAASLKVPEAEAAVDLGWKTMGTWSVHPERAKTSGSTIAGYADPAVFLDPEGTRLAVGGNDDKVRLVDTKNGKLVWTSRALGKDVDAIHPCEGDGFVARIYGGKAFTFDPLAKGDKKLKPLSGKMGWTSGLTDNCAHYVSDDFNGAYHLLSTANDAFAGSFSAPGTFDRRGTRVRGNLLVVGEPGKLRVLDLSDLREGPAEVGSIASPEQEHGGRLTQAWMVNPKLLVREYCSAPSCTVELVSFPEGEVKHSFWFNTQAAGWSPTVPSALDVDPTGASLFFFRRDLPPELMDVASGKRQHINAIVGSPPTEMTKGAFSADGKRLVLSTYPKTWQVTVLSR